MSEKEPAYTPEQVLMKAFEYFQTDTLSLDSLIKIAMANNCPSPDVAQGIILNLVEMDLLTWEKKGNQVLFTIKKKTDKPLQ